MTGILYEIIVFGELGLILGQFLHLIEKSAKTVVLLHLECLGLMT